MATDKAHDSSENDKPATTVADLHKAMTEGLIRDVGGPHSRDAAMGRGFYFGGLTRVGRRWLLFRKRGFPMPEENTPPTGQAARWLDDVRRFAPPSGFAVAKQLARLCGGDSQVATTSRSLADAVAKADKAGRERAYAERGVQWLVDNGWLHKEVVGKGRGASTTYLLRVPE